MATPRKSPKPKASAKAKPKTPTEAPSKSFAEVGREAAREAQRKVLLAALKAYDWNMTATGEALSMGPGANVIRALKALAPEEYEAAKADGRVSQANRRE